MRFNRHSNLEGLHAEFSPSQPSWLRYSDERAIEYRETKRAAQLGTEYHDVARKLIELKIKQPRSERTFYRYVNDAIGFHMKPEVVLFYSMLFWGTADAINYDSRTKTLRIHDLKTGRGPVHDEQLEIYAALFCLEYHIKPFDIHIILRIYQNDTVKEWEPDGDTIMHHMDTIVHLDKIINERMEEEE